jgi:non-ribosomal peptide synthetase component E (peptide arylation enzyme)
MELRECKFYYAGHEMNFAVFSDDPCRARYLESIPLPIIQTKVDVYEIEPGANTQWVAIQQKDGDKTQLKLFVRKGEKFSESQAQHLPKELKKKIMQRFPRLAPELQPTVAA